MGTLRQQAKGFFTVVLLGTALVILWPLIKFLIGLVVACLVVFGLGIAARVLFIFIKSAFLEGWRR